MLNTSLIEIQKEYLSFSVAHFTIFGPDKREPLHGHNYSVYCAIESLRHENGLSFDYRCYKDRMKKLCKTLHHSLLLPEQSQYLSLRTEGEYVIATFDGVDMPFLKSDVTLMPLCNISVEELSKWFIDQLTLDKVDIEKNQVQSFTVKVFTTPSQSGSTTWINPNA